MGTLYVCSTLLECAAQHMAEYVDGGAGGAAHGSNVGSRGNCSMSPIELGSHTRGLAWGVDEPVALRYAIRFLLSDSPFRIVRSAAPQDMPGHGSWGFGMPELVASACADVLDVTRTSVL